MGGRICEKFFTLSFFMFFFHRNVSLGIMDPIYLSRVVWLWMMLSMTMNNCIYDKSKASEVLNLGGGSSMGITFVLLLLLIASRKKAKRSTQFLDRIETNKMKLYRESSVESNKSDAL